MPPGPVVTEVVPEAAVEREVEANPWRFHAFFMHFSVFLMHFMVIAGGGDLERLAPVFGNLPDTARPAFKRPRKSTCEVHVAAFGAGDRKRRPLKLEKIKKRLYNYIIYI